MHIDRYEKWWMTAGGMVLAAFGVAVAVSAFSIGVQLPAPERRIDPRTVKQSGPFAEPGLRELAPGKYECYIRAEAQPWRFYPSEIRIPAGSTVTFYLTSADVQHGFNVLGTNLNFMVLPGQVSKLTHTFKQKGEMPWTCTEYCGVGHQNMYGKIIVE